ncbi:MAG TPA: c-type cytochrome [Gaiellaceae bacterium]|nr:c-type cytochrome [Gaiellaceae bacterium]
MAASRHSGFLRLPRRIEPRPRRWSGASRRWRGREARSSQRWAHDRAVRSTHAVSRAVAGLTLGLALLHAGPALAQDGKSIFERTCAGCHTIGGGDKVGPDLKGIGERAGRSWIERFVAGPEKVIASGDPVAKELLAKYKVPMPNLGLSQSEVAAVVDFLTGTTGPAPTTAPAATVPAPTTAPAATVPTPRAQPPRPPARGDAARGKNLFTGADRFANGGPPCLSCHSIAGIGSFGGGALGPDLTGAVAKYGGASGMRGVLATLPFPTMQPIFRGHALTSAEQTDLLAFLAQASASKRPGSSVGLLFGLGFGGVAVLVAATFVAWPRRALNVRRRLVDQSTRRS